MIHHKELPEIEQRFLCGLAAVEFDADLADKKSLLLKTQYKAGFVYDPSNKKAPTSAIFSYI